MGSIRISTRVLLAAVALAMVAAACLVYVRDVRRQFSAPTTITMGKVLKKGALLGRSRRSQSEYFCWVSYEFTPPAGGTRRNWSFWEPACGTTPGRAIPVQHVIADPDVNRPADSEPRVPVSLFFFAAGVTIVVGVLLRSHEQDDPPTAE
jgi:hypothetical protein